MQQAGKSLLQLSLDASARVNDEKNEPDVLKIYLPRDLRKSDAVAHYFSAKLEGQAQYYDTAYAQVSVFDATGIAALDCLSQSQPEITAWYVRERAKHSKSATQQDQ